MRLIIGGYAQGRLSYCRRKYGVTDADIWDAACSPLAQWQGQRVIIHAAALAAARLKQGKEPAQEVQFPFFQQKELLVISQEMGCGLVPVSPEERALREAVGRMNCALAEQAESVERVCCGLGMYLKNSAEER